MDEKKINFVCTALMLSLAANAVLVIVLSGLLWGP